MKDLAIKVVVKKVGEKPHIKVINNDIGELIRIVGGYVELVRVPFSKDNLYMGCNETGKIHNLPFNFYEPARSDMIVGNVFFTAGDYDGTLIDLTDEQIKAIKSYLETNTLWN